MKNLKYLAVAALVMATSATANASPIGPVYPAPGGNTYSTNGVNPGSGTQVRNYGGFNFTGYDSVWFGLDQVHFGVAGAGLDGLANPLTFSSVSGTTATWTGTTLWDNGSTHVFASTRLMMTLGGAGATAWTTDLASIGLDDTGTYGSLGAVALLNGSNYTVDVQFQANVGSGWQTINSVQQQLDHNGATRTNLATGFYYVETAAVPEPATMALLTLTGLGGLGLRLRRRQNKPTAA